MLAAAIGSIAAAVGTSPCNAQYYQRAVALAYSGLAHRCDHFAEPSDDFIATCVGYNEYEYGLEGLETNGLYFAHLTTLRLHK